jgi:hypothetical protein
MTRSIEEVFIRHTRAMLEHLRVPQRKSGEVIGFLKSLKVEVVQPQAVAV